MALMFADLQTVGDGENVGRSALPRPRYGEGYDN